MKAFVGGKVWKDKSLWYVGINGGGGHCGYLRTLRLVMGKTSQS